MAMQSDAHGSASEALSKYEYDHLQSKQHIRIMTIKPWLGTRNDEEPVRIRLEQLPVSKCPRYQALSYTWGQPQRSDRVIVNDRFYINVTPNLLGALVHLRRKRSVTIWIDAICINQEDIAERSSQVRLMAPIYWGAKKIIVWIDPGSPSKYSDDAPCIVVCPPKGLWSKATDGQWVKTGEGERHILELPQYALQMFQRPWFTRIWILQEIVYARRITILFGKREIEWDEALDWARSHQCRELDSRNTSVEEPVKFAMAMTTMMDDWRSRVQNGILNLPLSACAHESQFCESTDPKDKIFALLSIARDVSEHFDVDYTWSEAEICRRLTKHTIAQSNRLDILRCIDTRRTLWDMDATPSWVPNLFGDFRCDPLPSYNDPITDSGDQKLGVAPLCNSTTLAVKCLKVLDVIQISPARIRERKDASLRSMLTVFQQWYEEVCSTSYYFPGGSEPEKIRYRLNCFWGAIRMTHGCSGIEKHIHEPYAAGEGWHWHFRKIYHESVGDSQPEDEWDSGQALRVGESEIFHPDNATLYSPWAREVVFPFEQLRNLIGRAFGFTSCGCMVLLPAGAEVGDHIALLYGIQLPFVLRNGEQGCRIVGACYVHTSFDWEKFESLEMLEQVDWLLLK